MIYRAGPFAEGPVQFLGIYLFSLEMQIRLLMKPIYKVSA